MSAACQFCGKEDIKEGKFCLNCGYDPKTDAVNPSFKARPAVRDMPKKIKSTFLVKIFVILIILLTLFFIFYKNNYNISQVMVSGNAIIKQATRGDFVHIGSKEKSMITNRTEIKTEKALRGMANEQLLLGGIFFVPNNQSYVIINGEVFKEGEGIGNILVKKIFSEKVEVEVDGKSKILKVNESIYFIK